jgi:hypothetical protein
VFTKSDYQRIGLDNPIEKARREAEAKAKNSPRAKLRERQAQEEHSLQQRHRKEGAEMANRHAVTRGKDEMYSGHLNGEIGTRKELADRLQSERTDLTKAHHAQMKELHDRHARELGRSAIRAAISF